MPKIESNVLRVFSEKKIRGNPVRIQIVRWGSGSPMLEKREFWYDDENNEKMGKAKGLNSEDLEILLENSEEIQKLLES